MIFTGRKFIYFIFFIWLVLWITFVIHENKPGQYSDLGYLYSHRDYNQRVKYVFGNELYDFLAFCKRVLPEKATYGIGGVSKFDFDEVKTRYLLWPLKVVLENPDFIIFYHPGPLPPQVNGYSLFKQYNNSGYILAKVGLR